MADPVLHLLYVEVEAFVQQVTTAGVFEGVAVAQFCRPPGGCSVVLDEGVEYLAADGSALVGREQGPGAYPRSLSQTFKACDSSSFRGCRPELEPCTRCSMRRSVLGE